jgi:hypothetical protein
MVENTVMVKYSASVRPSFCVKLAGWLNDSSA